MFAVGSLIVLDCTRLGLIVRKLVHDDVLVDTVTNPMSLVQIGICEVVGPKEEPPCEGQGESDDESNLAVIAF